MNYFASVLLMIGMAGAQPLPGKCVPAAAGNGWICADFEGAPKKPVARKKGEIVISAPDPNDKTYTCVWQSGFDWKCEIWHPHHKVWHEKHPQPEAAR